LLELTVMTTLNLSANLAMGPDSVSADSESLASHMLSCASARGRFFALQTTCETVRDMLSARIVTVAACVAVIGGVVAFL
jgi:hypothetical protein